MIIRVIAGILVVLGLVCICLFLYVGVGELRWRYGRAKRERGEVP